MTAHQHVVQLAVSLRSVAGQALNRVNGLPFRRRAGPGRKSSAVRPDADIPDGDILGISLHTEVRTFLARRGQGEASPGEQYQGQRR